MGGLKNLGIFYENKKVTDFFNTFYISNKSYLYQ